VPTEIPRWGCTRRLSRLSFDRWQAHITMSIPSKISWLAVATLCGLVVQMADAASVDPASLVGKADVLALVGQPVLSAMPIPEEVDEDTGGMVSHCMYHMSSCAMIVSVVTFPSAAVASAKLTEQFAAGMVEGDGAKVIAESGLGERAFWAKTDEGVEYVVLKGNHVLGLSLGGKPPKALASYRDALRALVKSALEKL
jgi:hypothetical protein